MTEQKKKVENKGQDSVTMFISFLVGAAVGVGLIVLAESRNKQSEESYGEADLFV